MSELGRQFDPHRNYPVVRSVSEGDVHYTAVDPEGNRAYLDWLDGYHDVNDGVDEAARQHDDATRRRELAGAALDDLDDGDDRYGQAVAEYEDADADWEQSVVDLGAAENRRIEHGDHQPDEHAIGTILYRQQRFRPTGELGWMSQDREGVPRTLFRESQSPLIDMWAADPAYAGEGVGKELLNHAVEEHWGHFPSQRGTMPPISRQLSADSLDVMKRHVGERGGDGAILWTSERERMDDFARGEIRLHGNSPARLYMDHVYRGQLPEEGLDVSDPPTAWDQTQTTVAKWPSTSFEEKVDEFHDREERDSTPPPPSRPRPGTPHALRAQFNSPTGQLPMFVTGDELMRAATPHEGDRRKIVTDLFGTQQEDIHTFWDRKRAEADESGITESVAKKGVVRPVRVTVGGVIKNGHHRIAAAAASDSWLTPNWDENEGSMPGPMGDPPQRFDPRLVGLPKFNAR